MGQARNTQRRKACVPDDELLAREVFDTLLEAKVLIERWRKAYNTVRPHSSLGYLPPAPESRRPCPLASATPQRKKGS